MKKTYWDQYKEKLISASDAAKLVQSGDYIQFGAFQGRPIDYDIELAKRRDELRNVFIYLSTSLMPPLQTAMVDPSHEHFTCNNYYFSAIDRKMADNNLMFYLPCNLHESTVMMESDKNPPFTAVVQVSPMDEHGFFSFGPSNTMNYSACFKAFRVIMEVNQNIPRVPGGSEDAIHISNVDYIIEGSNTPLFELPSAVTPDENDKIMANFLMEEIQDRSCLQLGIGTLPDLLGELLSQSDIKDLGIHTEMFCNSMVKLFDQGLVTNKYKTFDRGKIGFTFCLGTKETYEFIENNPLMASHPAGFCNDPRIIGMNKKVVSINNALEVDLFSQVCAESSGFRQISGTGGQVDFVEGANNSKGGKSFLCLTSTYTDKQGNVHSRIVPTLEPGAIVTTPRSLVDYIVTEYGKAKIKGESTWRRAELLIELADPRFRDDLVKEAQRMRIWRLSNKQD
ncbi:MAG: acetyl-CoA hydrolase/transferase C-terminal domain-containing protein [Bacillota bacterium]|nr:acetyl-CoA hydrolase/transferase C-terminal domain-containing protein [Bacillota bacterium]